jgi:hypothetical protein
MGEKDTAKGKKKDKNPSDHNTPKGKGPPGYDGPPGHHPDGPPGHWDPPGVRRGQKDKEVLDQWKICQSRINKHVKAVLDAFAQFNDTVTREIIMTDVDREIPIPRAAADARESGAGADVATSATRAFEGSHKQTADTNIEELMSLLSGLTGGNSEFMESVNRLNAKRTYDQAQSFDLGTQYNDVLSRQRVNQIAEQHLQNAVETANILSKQVVGQVVRHADLAIDRQWNVDEVSNLTAKSGVEADAIIAAMVTAVTKAINEAHS